MPKKRYVVLYDEHVGPVVLSRNCAHVSIVAQTPPGEEAMLAAVARERKMQHTLLPMRCIHITGMLEIVPGVRYHIPFMRIWPFTSKLFDATFAREDAEAEPILYCGEEEV